MALEVSVDREGIDNLGERVADAQRERMKNAAKVGFAWSQEIVPEDEGLLGNTAFAPEWRDDNRLVWGYTQPYALDVEEGTEPYVPTQSEAEQILEWSKRVTGDAGLGHYVAEEKFPEEGQDAQPYIEPGIEKQKRALKGESFGEIFDGDLG